MTAPPTTDRPALLAATPEELGDLLAGLGEPRFRGRQLFSWLHRHGVADAAAMTNLPATLRAKLATLDLALPVEAGRLLRSTDGTRKIEVRLRDRRAVETVLIPDEGIVTQCVSTQVGCAVGCRFCRSGSAGLARNLEAAEIVGQVHLGRRHLDPGERLRNVVLMGVGEPLHNLDAVLRALTVLCHPDGLDLSRRRVTLSTVGPPRGLDRLAGETGGDVALAISLHATTAEQRAFLVPGVRATPAEIVAALARYPLAKRGRFTIEYVLLAGVNDSDEDARRLARLVAPLKVKINLLPFNPHDRAKFATPAESRVLAFQRILIDKGLTAIWRKRRGDDIQAACGQLLSTDGEG